jgi:hypothetical protein
MEAPQAEQIGSQSIAHSPGNLNVSRSSKALLFGK